MDETIEHTINDHQLLWGGPWAPAVVTGTERKAKAVDRGLKARAEGVDSFLMASICISSPKFNPMVERETRARKALFVLRMGRE